MKRFLSITLMSLLVLVMACSKKQEAEPAPVFEGTWKQTHQRTLIQDDKGLVLSDKDDTPATRQVYTFSGDTCTLTLDPAPTYEFRYPFTYTYSGDVLKLVPAFPGGTGYDKYQVLEFTKTALTLKTNTMILQNVGTVTYTFYFARQ
ncbi:hypothetical protein [Hymenobacter guriensis]|uniref:Lipocalin-like domain-containing protein n=1 Tax=Hymenobacter guriensis TaxID=2793065 RepID=A0ABS0L3Q1_9BACT|nr:hypothetical protein [Hymenobacter guriensis]MBG8554691.1 hypothetical protein [Hymenobacter guriensis]